ncbi:MAG: MFS transporter [Lysinibacillus sp.]
MPFKFIIFLTLLFQIALKGNILLIPLYGLHLQATPTTLGIIIAAGSVMPMLFASIIGRLSDHISIRLLLIVGMLGSSASLAAIFFFPRSIVILLIVQLLFGFFQIITVVSSQNLVGMLSTNNNRSQNYASYTLCVSIANLIGPLIVGITIDAFNYETAYLVMAIFAAIPGIFFIWIRLQISRPATSQNVVSKSFLQLLIDPQLRTMFITSGIILTGVSLFEFYFPIYTESLNISVTVIGMLVSLNALAFIISRLVMRPLQKKYRPEQIIGGCLSIAALAFFSLPFIETVWLLAIISFIMGLGLGCCQPLSIVMAYDYSPAGHSGEVLGTRLTINKAVQFSVPIIFGGLHFLGFFLIFWFNTALLGVGGTTLLRKFNKKQVAD